MLENIKSWLEFWGNCCVEGWHFGDWTMGVCEALSIVVYGLLLRKKMHHHIKWWEETMMKITGKFLFWGFLITTFCIAPFLKFQEADNRKTTQEKFDYINQNRPYLEAQLVIDSFDTNSISYHYDVQNTGNLPAILGTQEQKSPDFTAPEFQLHNRFLAPSGGRMEIPSDPVLTETGMPVDLYLAYQANYEETNLSFNDTFHFHLHRTLGSQSPQTDITETSEDPVLGTNTQTSLYEKFLNQPEGGISEWIKSGSVFFISTTNRSFYYDSKSRIAMFKSTLENGKPIVLISDIPVNSGIHGWHMALISWTTNQALLGIDTNSVTQNWQQPQAPALIGMQIMKGFMTEQQMKEMMKQGPPTNNVPSNNK